jgi:hypothetical protein
MLPLPWQSLVDTEVLLEMLEPFLVLVSFPSEKPLRCET